MNTPEITNLIATTSIPLDNIVYPANLLFFGIFGMTILFIAFLWSYVWKGLALWRAARDGNKVWFIVLLLVNLLGILEILYLFVFSPNKISLKKKKVVSQEEISKNE